MLLNHCLLNKWQYHKNTNFQSGKKLDQLRIGLQELTKFRILIGSLKFETLGFGSNQYFLKISNLDRISNFLNFAEPYSKLDIMCILYIFLIYVKVRHYVTNDGLYLSNTFFEQKYISHRITLIYKIFIAFHFSKNLS